jgi:hypothetical protein
LDRISNQKGVSYLLPSTSCRQVANSPVPSVGAPGHTSIFSRLTNQKINIRYKSTLPGGQVLDRISNRNTDAMVKLRRTRLSNLTTSPGGHVLDRIANKKGISSLLPSTSCRQVANTPVPSVGAGRRIKINIRYKSTLPGGQVLDRISNRNTHALERILNQKGVSYLLPSTSCCQVANTPVPSVGAGRRIKINIRYKSTLPGGQVLDRISNRNTHALDRISNQKGVSYLLPSTSCRQVANTPVPSVGAPVYTNILPG